MTLAVVIPTVVRSTLPQTVRACRQVLEGVPASRIEVWVNSNGALSSEQRRWLRECVGPKTSVHYHDVWWPTAEASAMSALSQTDAEWAWVMGDDDVPIDGSGPVVERLCTLNADLWLLNLQLVWHRHAPPGLLLPSERGRRG